MGFLDKFTKHLLCTRHPAMSDAEFPVSWEGGQMSLSAVPSASLAVWRDSENWAEGVGF